MLRFSNFSICHLIQLDIVRVSTAAMCAFESRMSVFVNTQKNEEDVHAGNRAHRDEGEAKRKKLFEIRVTIFRIYCAHDWLTLNDRSASAFLKFLLVADGPSLM